MTQNPDFCVDGPIIQLLPFTRLLHMPTRRLAPSGGTGPPFRSCRYAFYERHMMKKYILAMAACLAAVATPVLATDFKVEEATIPEIEQAFRDHRLPCHQLVQTYFDRIAAYDKQGPKLNAVLVRWPRPTSWITASPMA